MTKKDALTIALNVLSAEEYPDVVETLKKMVEQLSKPRSDESAAKASEKRKAATAAARQELITKVAPVLREVLTHTQLGLTAKEIFGEAQTRLPADFSVAKVQNVLLREMAPELEKIEAKGKANLYRLKETA